LANSQKVKDLTDGPLPADRITQGKVRLDVVPVAAAIFLFHDVPCPGEVVNDAVRRALGDIKRRGQIPEAGVGVVRDVQQGPGVVGQEAPFAHKINGSLIPELIC
jgi:hypothetical protein